MRLLIYGFGPIASFKKTLRRRFSGGCLGDAASKRSSSRLDFTRVSFSTPSTRTALTYSGPGMLLRPTLADRGPGGEPRRNINEKTRPILAGGPPSLKTSIRLALGRQGKSSNKAGEYVCNYSMYIVLDFIKRHRLPIRFGFIHIPHRYDYRKAMRLVEKAIGKIETAA
jgi:hypothetical protein